MIFSCFLYYSIIISSVAIGYLIENDVSSRKNIYKTILFLILWLPASIRYNIGTDYASYVDIYNHPDMANTLEKGFSLICNLLRYLECPVQVLFAVIAFLTYLFFVSGLPKKGATLSVLIFCLYIYLPTYSLIRQGLAICIVYFACNMLLRQKRFIFILSILGATCIHFSALLILPFYFLRRIPLNSLRAFIILIIGCLLINRINIIDIIFSSSIFLDSKYGAYASNSFNRETELGTGLGVIIKLLLPLIGIACTDQINKSSKLNRIIPFLCIVYIWAYLLSVQIHIFNRLVDLFTFVPIIIAGFILPYVNFNYKRTLLSIVIILNLIVFHKSLISSKSSEYSGLGLIPYRTIIQK